MKCRRPTCGRQYYAFGLCHAHHWQAVESGVITAGTTDASRSRKHVEWLTSQGLSQAEITRMSGVADPTLRRMRTHDRVLKSTEKRLLAVQPFGIEKRVADESKVSAVGSARRLQALVAIGYTGRHLCRLLEVEPVTVWRITTRSKNVELYLARKIHALFDELHMTPGPSVKARNRARKYGWVSSLAWDDTTIDDPEAAPDVGEATVVRFPERLKEITEDMGITNPDRVAAVLGITPDSLERQMYRHGLKEPA